MSTTLASACRDRLLGLCLTAAQQIAAECGAGTQAQHPVSGCGEPLAELLGRQAKTLARLYILEHHGSGDIVLREELEGSIMPEGAVGASTSDSREEARRSCHRLLSTRLDDLISLSYSRFYAYVFKELPQCWRLLYTDASILKFSLLFLSAPLPRAVPESAEIDSVLDELVKPLDLALILAGAAGHERGRRWIDEVLELLDCIYNRAEGDADMPSALQRGGLGEEDAGPPSKKPRLGGHGTSTGWENSPCFSTAEPFTPPIKNPIQRVGQIPMEAFQSYMDRPPDPTLGPQPLVITGLADDWPARTTRPWNRPAYLMSRTLRGRRLVPVEIGRSYVDDGWGQKIIPFADFLHDYIDATTRMEGGMPDPDLKSKDSVPTAYLAQHQLFSQLPRLRDDIRIPDYCYTAPPPPPPSLFRNPDDATGWPPAELDEPMLNAWLGPPGTITPLHTDPYHNVLVQVVGRKYVRLYAPVHTPSMAARGREGGVEMGNTSLLDVGVLEGWDLPTATGSNGEHGEDVGAEEAARARERDGTGRESTSETESQEATAFRKIPFVDCILEPGEALYIPVGWWHYVRGLSVSFSVSFWWN